MLSIFAVLFISTLCIQLPVVITDESVLELFPDFQQLKESYKQCQARLNEAAANFTALRAEIQGSHKRIAFSAYKQNDWTTDRNTWMDVVFEKTYFNDDNAYNTATGVFTAPSDGLYLFSWTIVIQPDTLFDSQIQVNGRMAGLLNCNGNVVQFSIFKLKTEEVAFPPGTNNACSNTAPLILKKDDRVNIRKRHGTFMYGSQWSSFKGVKLN